MKKNLYICILFIIIIIFSGACGGEKKDKKKPELTKITVKHILVGTKEKAEEVLKKLKKGEDFAKLANEFSKCPSKVNGGKLEPFEKGTKAKEFEEACLKLKVGETSEPIETEEGWDIIQRLETLPDPTATPTATPGPIRIRHIVVEKEEEAKEIAKELKEGKDFTELAKEKSLCPSRAKGGDLGLISYGKLVKEMNEVVFKLKTGEISEPFKTEYGWHVVQRIEPTMKIEQKEDEKVRVRHILVEKKEEAEEIIKELKEGKDFTKLAMKHSLCPTKVKGGDLGLFGIGKMAKPLEDAAFKLKVGEFGEVETKYGWHVIQRIDPTMKIELPPEKIRVSHILVEKKEDAEEIIKELKSGKNFEEVAKEKSKCPSKDKGGDLGEIEKDSMVKEFEEAAFALDVGEISEPVETQYGWHIIKRTE